MNRKQRRSVQRNPERRKQHDDARMLVGRFMDKVETTQDITEAEYHNLYNEYQAEWLAFAKTNDFNKDYFHDIFKLDFKVLRSIEKFEKMTVPEIIDLAIDNYRKMRDRKKQPYRRPVGPTKSNPIEGEKQ